VRALELVDGFGKSAFALQTLAIPLMCGRIVGVELQSPAKLGLGRGQLHIKQQGIRPKRCVLRPGYHRVPLPCGRRPGLPEHPR